jgi:hypothetical protein
LFNGCFGLLFPATELRHRIYDFAIEDMVFKLNLDPVVLIHGEVLHEQYGILPAAELSNWSDEHREFYGLTQTCRQMRLEFRPLHQACFKVIIETAQLEHYIGTFIPEIHDKPLEAYGNIEVYEPIRPVQWSVASLIRTLSESPNIEVTTCPGWENLQPLLQAKSKNPKWWLYFNERVQDVCLHRVGRGHLHIKVFLKSHFVESWMREYWDNEEEDWPFRVPPEFAECIRAKEEWLQEINLRSGRHYLRISCLGTDEDNSNGQRPQYLD